MLILVAVTIDIAVDGKLFDTAREAVDKTNDAVAKQDELVGHYMGKLDGVTGNQGGGPTQPEEDESKYTYSAPGGEYVDGGKKAVVPGGFTVSGLDSENTINEGLVIYLIPDGKTVDWTNPQSVANAQKTYDQFVWIPVGDVNDMFMCQSEGTDTDGSGTVEEDEYNSCRIDASSGVAKCTTHNSTAMAGRLYATETGDSFNATFKKQTYTADSGLREPDVVSEYDGSYLSNMSGILGTTGYDTLDNFKNTLQTDYNEIVKKVCNSKGFWVGRYETSNMTKTDGTAVKIVAGTTNEINYINWYYMYAQQKDYATNKGLTGITSSMIQGAAYDQVMKFVDGAKDGANDDYIVTAINAKRHKWGDIGSNLNDKVKNIFDLEGNVHAWTIEATNAFRSSL